MKKLQLRDRPDPLSIFPKVDYNGPSIDCIVRLGDDASGIYSIGVNYSGSLGLNPTSQLRITNDVDYIGITTDSNNLRLTTNSDNHTFSGRESMVSIDRGVLSIYNITFDTSFINEFLFSIILYRGNNIQVI